MKNILYVLPFYSEKPQNHIFHDNFKKLNKYDFQFPQLISNDSNH